ncbi:MULTISPECIES: ATP-binding cassette domain-containing protein [unclassified Leptolyngbya]|uniref:ATP-binding cassette domain-containing protein n=1 Tax=unclassified Leptolyngbya TaxID=2650499 RepID=UPI0016883BC9|nr:MULTISPECIES: ATP-binding cassette domain-containing protein [unclassified Leptolyngbya]MBD1913234.1 ATP-binding cassette domain-containing protein [Leptolyngbya sp. FACHB-8]MBD2153376.1 ATP-binding cassette domain-containing protein [Leptolyngbya sp. FACHB-16]
MERVNGADVKVMGLTKTYGETQVLRNLDLDIAPGEFVAIVGRSGGGKSTLLRLIAGFEAATQGGILIDGMPLKGRNRATCTMFQNDRLLPWERVLGNIGLGLQQKNWQQKAQQALEQVGLADRANEFPSVLSGGQKQRVALARALVREPRLLMLDEPLGALDALTRIEMQRLIEDLWLEQQFSVFLITHDVDEAVTLGDRVLLIENGQISLDMPIPLPRPRQRKSQAFVNLSEDILERVMRTPASLANTIPDGLPEMAHAH